MMRRDRFQVCLLLAALVVSGVGVVTACGSDDPAPPAVGEDAGPRTDARPPALDADAADASEPADAEPDAAPPPETCSSDGFCWMNPLPTGNAMHAVWRGPGGEVWTVGEAGTAVRWSKGSPTVTPTGTQKALRGVWGATSSDVWAVGDDGVTAHFDGAKWTVSSLGSSTLNAVRGVASTDVWAVGDGGAAYHFDGASWVQVTEVPSGSYRAVHPFPGGDVLVGGTSGGFDGLLAWRKAGTWSSSSPTGGTSVIRSIWAVDANKVWLTDGALWSWDGLTWRKEPVGTATSVYGTSADDVWITTNINEVQRWNGSVWSKLTASPGSYKAIAVAGPKEVWLAGEMPGVVGWDGVGWRRLGAGDVDRTAYLSVFPRSATNVWLGGGGPARRWDGSSFVQRPLPYGNSDQVWSSGSNVWVSGNGGTVFLDVAGTWKDLDCPISSGVNVLFGSGPNDLWAISYSSLARWNGTGWSPVLRTTDSILGAWAASPTDMWLAAGDLLRFDGATITSSLSAPREGFAAVWGAAADDVWAVGDGVIRRWRGSSWSDPVAGIPKVGLNAVWGRSASDVWAVGDRGTVLHFDGTSWSVKDSGTTRALTAVRGLPGGEIWVVGDYRAVLRKR